MFLSVGIQLGSIRLAFNLRVVLLWCERWKDRLEGGFVSLGLRWGGHSGRWLLVLILNGQLLLLVLERRGILGERRGLETGLHLVLKTKGGFRRYTRNLYGCAILTKAQRHICIDSQCNQTLPS